MKRKNQHRSMNWYYREKRRQRRELAAFQVARWTLIGLLAGLVLAILAIPA